MSLRALLQSTLTHLNTIGDDDLSLAVECAILAGEHIRQGWEGGLEALQVQEKGVGDLVSQVDLLAEGAILDVLRARCPDDQILSEESEATTVAEGQRRMWIVDPLDGTASFVFHTQPELVSVLIALYDGEVGRVTRAVELFPLGVPRCVYAVWQRGAFVDGVPLVVPHAVKVPLEKAWVNLNIFGDVRYESPMMATLHRLLRTPGSSCRMVTTFPASSGVACQILLGNARLSAIVHDNHPVRVKQGPWDTAAPQLIVEEAGGVFLNGITGERYDTLNPTIIVIAATRELAEEIMRVAKK